MSSSKIRLRARGNLSLILAAIMMMMMIILYFMIPQGSHVEAVVEVSNNDIVIIRCNFKKLYPISIIDPDEDVSVGDNIVVLYVILNNEEILSTRRINIGIGTCKLATEILPDNIERGSELQIVSELYNLQGEIVASDQVYLSYP